MSDWSKAFVGTSDEDRHKLERMRMEHDIQMMKADAAAKQAAALQNAQYQAQMSQMAQQGGILGAINSVPGQWSQVSTATPYQNTHIDGLEGLNEIAELLGVPKVDGPRWGATVTGILREIIKRTNIAPPIKNKEDMISAIMDAHNESEH